MRVKWAKLANDSLLTITLPLWILPALSLLAVFKIVEAFIENYTEP